MAAPDNSLESAVAAVLDPELSRPIGELGMVREVHQKRRRASVTLALPLRAWPAEASLVAAVREAAATAPGVEEVAVDVEFMDDAERAALRGSLRSAMGVGEAEKHGDHDHGTPMPAFLAPGSSTRVIGVGSGKGGVGKSSVTVNLAIALAQTGQRVGILDADVYGFSVPKMLGTDHDPIVLGDLVVPTTMHGVKCLSMGFFVPDDQPVIWRGPLLHKAIEQFLADAYWGELDFLLVDMPPGTGDVTLSLAQVMPAAELIVVTTPQAAAQRVAQRAAFAARKLKLSVRGVVENMSYFTGDDGTRYELFGSGGGQALADDLGVPLLATMPLVPALREGGDVGIPIVVSDPDGNAAQAFAALARRVSALGPARVYRRELALN